MSRTMLIGLGAAALIGLGAAALAGCATGPPPAAAPPLTPTPVQAPQRDIVTTVGPRDPAYAIPERLRQQHLAQREAVASFQQEAQAVHERVRGDPAFGGFILRWSPEPHAVVMFTGDAEARLRRYTADPRFRGQRVELTLAQLERMKDELGAQLARLGLKCFSVDGDEEHNTVTVGAPPEELAKIRAGIAAGRVKAAARLRLKEEGCATWR